MLRYAITDRKLYSSRQALLEQAARWAAADVDCIQIREKDMDASSLAELAFQLVESVRSNGQLTRVLLNGPAVIAAEAGCDGVHLPSGLPGSNIETARFTFGESAIISVSCHTLDEIRIASNHGASLVLFAPVFEKRMDATITPGRGLAALAAACVVAGPIPVIALGGITPANASDCIAAGAAGIAGIRLFSQSKTF